MQRKVAVSKQEQLMPEEHGTGGSTCCPCRGDASSRRLATTVLQLTRARPPRPLFSFSVPGRSNRGNERRADARVGVPRCAPSTVCLSFPQAANANEYTHLHERCLETTAGSLHPPGDGHCWCCYCCCFRVAPSTANGVCQLVPANHGALLAWADASVGWGDRAAPESPTRSHPLRLLGRPIGSRGRRLSPQTAAGHAGRGRGEEGSARSRLSFSSPTRASGVWGASALESNSCEFPPAGD